MSNRPRPSYHAIDFGPLPIAKINAVLGTELEPGNARLSAAAHRHIAEDHPEDYQACMRELPLVLSSPSFIGQAPGSGRNFEMIRRLKRSDGKEALVAIGLEPAEGGTYRVVSSYLISGETVEKRRQAKRLKPPPS